MSDSELWARFKRDLIISEECGVVVDTSRVGIPAGFEGTMAPKIAAAFTAMAALEKGAIANPDEKRRVGHYWLRAPELAPEKELGDEIRSTVEKIHTFAAAVHSGKIAPERGGKFEHLLVIGIGGSALGPELAAAALGSTADKLTPHFFDNTDPDGFDRVLARIGDGLAKTLTVVMSKSGGTKETRNGMVEARAAYEKKKLTFGKHAVAVTGVGSELDKVAIADGFLERFPMWDWIGGRTSELSAVGLVPAALQGIDTAKMLEGAKVMDVVTRTTDAHANPAMALALSWYAETGGAGKKDMVILPYKDRLELTSRYLQQLVMESLGKEHDLDGKVVNQGIAVYGNKGSTDQHAYVQQLRDGVPNFFVTFIEVLKDRDGAPFEVEKGVTSGDYLQGFLLGTRRALFEKGRGSITITLDEVTPRSLGSLIALYERAVGFYGSLVNVNAYHQPGVEAGKKAASDVLAIKADVEKALTSEARTAEQIATSFGKTDAAETAYKVLEHLAANKRGVVREGGRAPGVAKYRRG